MASATIRDERAEDADAIRAVTLAAFAGMPYSEQTEAAIVDALRAAGALAISLVAVEDDGIVGHVAFSPVAIDGTAAPGWFGIGPLSVRPDRQRRGIGAALMRADLERAKLLGGKGSVLVAPLSRPAGGLFSGVGADIGRAGGGRRLPSRLRRPRRLTLSPGEIVL